jgi:hypothetical protein
MLSPEVFTTEFLEFLCVHFRKEVSERIQFSYYKAFKHYSDQTFTELCELAFQECKFMPEPLWFSDRAEELSARACINEEFLLPTAVELELNKLTEADRIENIKRIKRMMVEYGAVKTLPGVEE